MRELFSISLLLLFSLLFFSCSTNSNPVGNSSLGKLAVEIISPVNNSEVSDTTIIEVKATDDKGIVRVEIYIDSLLVTKLFIAPYRYIWDTRSLLDSTNHTIFARAYDTDSNMVISKSITITNYVIAPPTNLTVSQIADGTVLLSWKDNSRIETGFEIEMSKGGDIFYKVDSVNASINIDVISSLVKDTIYSFRVRAISKQKSSIYSNIVETKTILNPPYNLTSELTGDTLILNWQNESYAISTDVEMSTDSISYTKIISLDNLQKSMRIPINIISGNKYYFRLKARGTFNSSNYSNIAGFECIFDAPTSLKYSSYNEAMIKLEWNDNSNCESGFEIEQSTDNISFVKITEVSANINNANINGNFSGLIYYYRVRAKFRIQYSPYSPTIITSIIVPKDEYIFMGESNLTRIYKIRLKDSSVIAHWSTRSISAASSIQGIGYDGTNFWISLSGTDRSLNKISLPDADTNVVSLQSPYPLTYSGGTLRSNTFSNGFIYQIVSETAPTLGKIFRIDPSSGVLLDTIITPGSNPRGITWFNGKLYCNDTDLDLVYVYNSSTKTWTSVFSTPVPTGGSKFATGFTSDYTTYWIANSSGLNDHLFKLSPTGQVVQMINTRNLTTNGVLAINYDLGITGIVFFAK